MPENQTITTNSCNMPEIGKSSNKISKISKHKKALLKNYKDQCSKS